MSKTRLDVAVFEKGFAQSREKAQALIMAGQVYVDGQKSTKAGTQVSDDNEIIVRGNQLQYVSRGGLKLEKALKVFSLDLKGKTCLDVGASTGGFTDCMLKNDARKVYAVDVGYGQLAWELRTSDKVENLERTNFRYITENEIPEPIDFASIDVSFISLHLIFPALFPLLKDGGQCVALIKPQFEAGREKVGKRGVVREEKAHIEVIIKVFDYALRSGFSVLNIDYSPITGPEGNIEYLLFIAKDEEVKNNMNEHQVKELVLLSHKALKVGN